MYDPLQQRGAAALMTILLVGAATLIMAMNAIWLGINDLEVGQLHEVSGNVEVQADTCIEEALVRIKKDSSYGVGSGAMVVSVLDDVCTITVTDLGSNQRRVEVLASVDGEYHKRYEVELTLSGSVLKDMTIDAWEELTD